MRWLLLTIMDWLWPVKLTEKELIAYGKEIERNKPEVLHYSTGIHTIMYLNEHPELKQVHVEANDETARELQRYLDEHRQSAHYEPPEQRTEAISLESITSAYHKAHLLPIDSLELEAFVVTEKRRVV